MVIDFIFFEHAQVRLLPPACSSKIKIAGTVAHRRLFWKLFDGEKEVRARPVAERESCRQLPFRAPVQTQTPRVGSRPVPGWLARPRPAAGPSRTPTGHRRAEDSARLPAPGTTRTELPGVPCRARCHPTKDHVAADPPRSLGAFISHHLAVIVLSVSGNGSRYDRAARDNEARSRDREACPMESPGRSHG